LGFQLIFCLPQIFAYNWSRVDKLKEPAIFDCIAGNKYAPSLLSGCDASPLFDKAVSKVSFYRFTPKIPHLASPKWLREDHKSPSNKCNGIQKVLRINVILYKN